MGAPQGGWRDSGWKCGLGAAPCGNQSRVSAVAASTAWDQSRSQTPPNGHCAAQGLHPPHPTPGGTSPRGRSTLASGSQLTLAWHSAGGVGRLHFIARGAPWGGTNYSPPPNSSSHVPLCKIQSLTVGHRPGEGGKGCRHSQEASPPPQGCDSPPPLQREGQERPRMFLASPQTPAPSCLLCDALLWSGPLGACCPPCQGSAQCQVLGGQSWGACRCCVVGPGA